MKKLAEVGRLLFGIALLEFAWEYVVYTLRLSWPLPGPPWYPNSQVMAAITALILLAAGISILLRRNADLASGLIAMFFFLRALVVHLPKLLSNLHDPGPWTSGSEMLALCGGALVLAGTLRSNARSAPAIELGRSLFAATLMVFAIQHFMYARFIATLIPAWIPAPYFWALFVGVAFLAAAASILSGKFSSLGSGLLGVMFASWFLMLHLPRVAAKPHDGNEWTSAFIALAMSGCAFIMAGVMPPQRNPSP